MLDSNKTYLVSAVQNHTKKVTGQPKIEPFQAPEIIAKVVLENLLAVSRHCVLLDFFYIRFSEIISSQINFNYLSTNVARTERRRDRIVANGNTQPHCCYAERHTHTYRFLRSNTLGRANFQLLPSKKTANVGGSASSAKRPSLISVSAHINSHTHTHKR